MSPRSCHNQAPRQQILKKFDCHCTRLEAEAEHVFKFADIFNFYSAYLNLAEHLVDSCQTDQFSGLHLGHFDLGLMNKDSGQKADDLRRRLDMTIHRLCSDGDAFADGAHFFAES